MTTYRARAWDIAMGQFGYITTEDAAKNGIPPVELAKLAARGRLRNVARGIYHFDDMPPTKFDQYFEAVLRVGKDAFLTGDAVLALHNLALVNPKRIRVGTRTRRRKNLPDWVKMIQEDVRPEDVVVFEGIPTTNVTQAIREAKTYVMAERLIQALPTAREEGLINPRQEEVLRQELLEVRT
jgi:predicted transcriptional regulator of viral defense system